MATAGAEQKTDTIPNLVPVRYSIQDAAIAELGKQYLSLKVAGVNDKAGLKAVHEARMVVRRHRITIDKTREQLKEAALTYGRTVDGEAKRLTALIAPIEKHLQDEEDRIEAEQKRLAKEEADRKQAILESRMDAFISVGVTPNPILLAGMSEDDYVTALSKATDEWAAKVKAEAERAAELERLQAAEAQRIAEEQAEAARIRAEEDARRKAEAEALAKERAELDRQRAEQAAAQAKVAAEQKAEADRLAAERRKIEEEIAAKQRAEELEAAKAKAIEQARIDEEARIAREQAEAKRLADIEEAERLRLEALKPDREKFMALANTISNIERPSVSPEAHKAMVAVEKAIANAVVAIRKAANEL